MDNSTLEEALAQITAANQLFYKVVDAAQHHRHPRQRAEARAVRRAGHPHLLHLARRRHRAGAAREHRHPRRRRPGGADGGREQDRQHDHRPRHDQRHGDHRAAGRRQRQPARRDHGRRPDPRGQQVADQAVRARPRRLHDHDGLLARAGSPRRHGHGRRRHAPGTAPTPGPAPCSGRARSTSTASRAASTPRTSTPPCRRPRCASSRATRKRASSPSRSCAAPKEQKLTLNLGEEVPVPSTTFTPVAQGGAAFNPLTSFTYRPVGVNVEITPRVTYEGDITLELLIENSSLGDGLIGRGPEPAVVQLAEGADAAAAARRRVEPAGRAAAGGRAAIAARLPGDSAAARHQAALLVQRQHDRPDRHRDAADAAHRANARAVAAGRQSHLRRHAAEPRPGWAAADDRAGSSAHRRAGRRGRAERGRARRGARRCRSAITGREPDRPRRCRRLRRRLRLRCPRRPPRP